jgi:uncharacterized protein YyaL (SSP411 family)
MEGAFYLWRASELDTLLGEASPLVKRRFGILDEGNAPFDPQQEFTGKNLLYVARSIGDLATEFGMTSESVSDALAGARLLLFQARLSRPHPHLDDKVLTAWNGLMIAAFARAAKVLRALVEEGRTHGQQYLDAARRAARFVRASLWDDSRKVLLRRYRDGHAGIDGYAEDYAYLIFGLLELFQADPSAEWLDWAVELQQRQDELFWDDAAGGWFSTTGQDPTVLLRMKEEYDGAEPSASAVSMWNLLVLSHLHQQAEWPGRIERTLRLFAPRLSEMGRAVPMMAAAYEMYLAGVSQVVVAGDGEAADALFDAAAGPYRPFTLTLAVPDAARAGLAASAPFLALMAQAGGEPAAYVCRDFACQAPTTDPDALRALLG